MLIHNLYDKLILIYYSNTGCDSWQKCLYRKCLLTNRQNWQYNEGTGVNKRGGNADDKRLAAVCKPGPGNTRKKYIERGVLGRHKGVAHHCDGPPSPWLELLQSKANPLTRESQEASFSILHYWEAVSAWWRTSFYCLF